MDCSLPGSSVHGILQKRILEWVAIRGRAGQTGCAACGFGVRPAGTAVTGPGLADPPRPWGGCSLDGLGREPGWAAEPPGLRWSLMGQSVVLEKQG